MISALQVKELREKTGAGMMDCKKALTEVNGDFEGAIDWLRTKGLSAAAKKAGRVTAQGLTAAKVSGTVGAVIEVNSETDFVAMNDKFQTLVRNIAEQALQCENLEALGKANLPNGKTVSESITEAIGSVGENLNLRRMAKIEVKEGIVNSYIHNSVGESLGKIAVLVGLESKADKVKLATLGKQIAMHIAATKPKCLDINSIDPVLVTRERQIFIEQARASGKPDNIIEKMVEGRIRKFFEEVVLLEQKFVIDGETRISEVLNNAAKEYGETIALKGFIRFEIGEGIEKEEKNFADEVAAVLKN